jgi:hypothetical protein
VLLLLLLVVVEGKDVEARGNEVEEDGLEVVKGNDIEVSFGRDIS